ncbi:hypothetical protein B0H11DRAFT_541656 [Mycena galericulata]|nr:hypothetical protein B0H11DRAFT_541656 [Mycena galericulata]
MHRCLEMPDVLDVIVSHLPAAPMEESPEAWDLAAIRRRALASLACASRNFKEPALNALWRFQETIMNLLNLIPAGLWERLDGAMRPTRRLVQEDFNRLEQYSHRVKHLELWEQGPTFVHVFGALRLVLPANSALLPNLHFLLWTYSDGAVYPFIDLFLGPELKALIFGGAQGCNEHYALLAKLEQTITPTLWTFCLDPPAPGSTPPPTNWVSNFARRMTHIKVFLVGAPIDLSALIHLGGLETLHTFQATLPTSISIPEPLKATLFSNIGEVTLRIEGGGIPAATEFVRTWNTPPVESFNGNYSGCVVLQHLEDFHGVLGTHCRLDTLKKFNLCLWDKSPGCLYPGHLLTSLVLFHNLTVLYISAYEGYEITDEIVSSLARAWPQPEEFHLASAVQSRRRRPDPPESSRLRQRTPDPGPDMVD